MNASDFSKGVLTGIALGVVGGILFAPKAGKETREEIKKRAIDFKEKAAEKIGNIRDGAKASFDDTIDKFMGEFDRLSLSQMQKEDIRNELKGCFERIKDITEDEY